MSTCDSHSAGEDMRLIVRVQTAPALWQYMGQYDSHPSDPLSAQEWAMQSRQVCSSHPTNYYLY